jgi:hypothetical protein
VSTAKRRTQLEAEQAQLQALIGRTRRLIERVGLEERLEEVTAELAAIALARTPQMAETDLTFNGEPVVGTEGIDAAFASDVLSSYQDIVARVFAARESVLLGMGPIPEEHRSHLHVTGVIHGSFGFALREIATQPTAQPDFFQNETPLAAAVEDAAAIIEAAGKDDDAFLDAAEELNPRVHDAVRKFFTTVKQAGASFRLATSRRVTEFGYERIAAAVDRVSVRWRDEFEERLLGTFYGALHGSRTFEHKLETGEVIKGKADPQLDLAALSQWTQRRCVAHLRVKLWQKGTAGRVYKRYMLLGIDAAGPDDLVTPQP